MNNLQGLSYKPGHEIRKSRRSPADNRATACRALQKLTRRGDAAKGEGRGTHLPCAATLLPDPDNPDHLRDLGPCCVNPWSAQKVYTTSAPPPRARARALAHPRNPEHCGIGQGVAASIYREELFSECSK